MGIELNGLDNPVAIWGMEDVLVFCVTLVAISLFLMARRSYATATNVGTRGWYLFLSTLGLTLSLVFGLALGGGWRASGAAGKSMLPTLPTSNLIVVNAYAYGLRRPFGGWVTGPFLPRRGDVISFHFQVEGADRLLSKRVVALPGDRVRYEDGRLFVNETPVAGHARGAPHMAGQLRVSSEPATLPMAFFHVWAPEAGQDALEAHALVPAAHVFVVGDNWAESFDSRQFGAVPISALRGQVRWAWSGALGWQAP